MGLIVKPRNPSQILWAGNYLWRDHDGGPDRPGVGILYDQRVIQHLTPAQALKLADQLVDAAEAATRADTPVNHQRLQGGPR